MHEQISVIRKSLEVHVGKKVRVTSRKSRKKTIVRQGVIDSTYPSIFIIRYECITDAGNEMRKVSYSYVDILTHSVELALYKEQHLEAQVS